MTKIPKIYFIYGTIVLIMNLFGYYLPFVQNLMSMETFYLIMLPFQLSVLVWFLILIFLNAPLHENISVFMVIYFFLQAPFMLSMGLREAVKLQDFSNMMMMVVIGFSMAVVFILVIVDIWPSYVALTIIALLGLRFLNLDFMGFFNVHRVSSDVLFGTVVYAILAIGVIWLEAYTLYRFYELEE